MLTPTFSRLAPVLRSSASDVRPGRSIMVRYFKNKQTEVEMLPTVIFVPGFMSHGLGLKAEYLARHCSTKYNYLCYDPEGLAESPSNFKTLQFRDWFEDCQTAIEIAKEEGKGCPGGLVLVGSSMGGWISLKMALDNKALIKGLVLIAPAHNFMWLKYQSWYNECSITDKQKLDSGDCIIFDTAYGEMVIRKEFAEKSRELEFEEKKPIQVECPIRIIHGVEDETVPFERSLKLMEAVVAEDVDLIYRKKGKHRLSEDHDLKLISKTLDDLIEQLKDRV